MLNKISRNYYQVRTKLHETWKSFRVSETGTPRNVTPQKWVRRGKRRYIYIKKYIYLLLYEIYIYRNTSLFCKKIRMRHKH